MVNANKYFYIVVVSISLLSTACNTHVDESNEVLNNDVIIDSANDAWFDCYINRQKWEKSDVLTASISVKSNASLLNFDFRYNSVTYEYINLKILLGKKTASVNKQLVQLVNDTILASIIYSFAEIDYSSESLFPENHMAFEVKPTALVCISKVDTVKNSIDGTFKAIAVDEKQRKYIFTNGIFRNIPYNKLAPK